MNRSAFFQITKNNIRKTILLYDNNMKIRNLSKNAIIYATFMLCSIICHAQRDNYEIRFPHHYSEFLGSYQNRELFAGGNYSYIPGRIGIYGSFMHGFDGNYYANIGPVVRLTNGNSTGVDIHLFQGLGMNSGVIEGETGIRFGFGRDKAYGLWSISGSLCYSSNGIGWTAGLSWPIAGITAASGVIIGYAILAAYTGISLPDLNQGGAKPTTSSESKTKNSNQSGEKSCNQYVSEYDSQLSEVIRNYNTYSDSKKYGSSTSQAQFRRNLVSSQSKLKKIRREASAHGCSISASSYESAMP